MFIGATCSHPSDYGDLRPQSLNMVVGEGWWYISRIREIMVWRPAFCRWAPAVVALPQVERPKEVIELGKAP